MGIASCLMLLSLPMPWVSRWMNFAEITQNRPKPNNPMPSGSFYAAGRFSLFCFWQSSNAGQNRQHPSQQSRTAHGDPVHILHHSSYANRCYGGLCHGFHGSDCRSLCPKFPVSHVMLLSRLVVP